jgi:hypothetical protein
MSTQAYKEAVELAVDRWNAHDERYFEAYTEHAWNRMDEVGLMTQLGLMPAPA